MQKIQLRSILCETLVTLNLSVLLTETTFVDSKPIDIVYLINSILIFLFVLIIHLLKTHMLWVKTKTERVISWRSQQDPNLRGKILSDF